MFTTKCRNGICYLFWCKSAKEQKSLWSPYWIFLIQVDWKDYRFFFLSEHGICGYRPISEPIIPLRNRLPSMLKIPGYNEPGRLWKRLGHERPGLESAGWCPHPGKHFPYWPWFTARKKTFLCLQVRKQKGFHEKFPSPTSKYGPSFTKR